MSQKLKLYTNLAEVYDQLYDSLFDYEKDAALVDAVMKRFHFHELLELGCGTGHLTQRLAAKGYRVVGVDLHEEMLAIARRRLPEVTFHQQDIRELKFDIRFNALVMLGRTFTYMTTIDDVERCLASCARRLKPGGVLLFDNFSAPHFVRDFKPGEESVVEVETPEGRIRRVSKNTWNLGHGVTFNWQARYEIQDECRTRTVTDDSVLRAFFPEEIDFFLRRQGLHTLEVMDEGFAFTTVAQK